MSESKEASCAKGALQRGLNSESLAVDEESDQLDRLVDECEKNEKCQVNNGEGLEQKNVIYPSFLYQNSLIRGLLSVNRSPSGNAYEPFGFPLAQAHSIKRDNSVAQQLRNNGLVAFEQLNTPKPVRARNFERGAPSFNPFGPFPSSNISLKDSILGTALF